jgi:hypothetical protein
MKTKAQAQAALSVEEVALLKQIEERIDSRLDAWSGPGDSVDIDFSDLQDGFNAPKIPKKITDLILKMYRKEWKVGIDNHHHSGQFFRFS